MVRDESFAWFKRPAHDVGKVLAVGAIAAVFVAWLFATAEYLPTPRSEDGRLNAQIGLIADAASQFDLLVQQYIKFALEKDTRAANYYDTQIGDPRIEKMIDFNVVPRSHWPSMEVHRAFNEYLFSSIMLMETSADEDTSIKLQDRIAAYGKKFEMLKKSLETTRR